MDGDEHGEVDKSSSSKRREGLLALRSAANPSPPPAATLPPPSPAPAPSLLPHSDLAGDHLDAASPAREPHRFDYNTNPAAAFSSSNSGGGGGGVVSNPTHPNKRKGPPACYAPRPAPPQLHPYEGASIISEEMVQPVHSSLDTPLVHVATHKQRKRKASMYGQTSSELDVAGPSDVIQLSCRHILPKINSRQEHHNAQTASRGSDDGIVSPSHLMISAAAPSMMAEVEGMRQKKQKAKKQKKQLLEPKLGSSRLLAPETLSSEVDPAMRGEKHEEDHAAAALLESVEEAGGKEKMQKSRKHEEEAVSPSQSAVAWAPICRAKDKTANVVAPAPDQGKRKRRRVNEQEQMSQTPLPFDVHPQGAEKAAEGPECEKNVAVRSSSRMCHTPSIREIIRKRSEAVKQQPLPEGLLEALRNNSTENSNYSSPVGVFLDRFRYIPDRERNRNSATFPRTPDRPATSPPPCHLSSEPSQLADNGTSKAAEKPILNASVSLSQEGVQAKDNVKAETKMNVMKKQGKPKPLLKNTEKKSEMYRRIPLDQLVPPPRSPHKLLQEKYASDPWKVVVICMLLNLTQGKQVRKKIKGFFKRYPDPQTASRADPDKMTEYLTPLGLQKVKTERIQRFSKEYVETEWAYITDLCGVGKYAADAYAIFCAGKATEVVPKDHKLVDYWKYVCFELPSIQGLENAQEPGMTDHLKQAVPEVQELAVCC